ncbi:MAG TPA: NAD-dependent epimerase/dehydratase family protein [Acidimicrobiales bacterium]|nr:NAD-dependent epimerase/dehydratase family protein [Acidimicrobiales bacterium]
MSFALRPGDRVVVTGAAGFIGSAVTRALIQRGVDVVALLEPGASSTNLEGLEVERRDVDITKIASLNEVFAGVRFCFHLAAKFGFWPKDHTSFYAVNVDGSRNVVRAATEAGVERIVYTSTVATLGLWGTKSGRPSNEDDVADLSHLYGNYKKSKYVAEHEVLRLAAAGAPVVLVLPTMPHGPYDQRPTPSGKVVLDFLNGRMPGYVDTAMNIAHVDDLAEGHLLALEKGSQGRSYVCGGENVTMAKMLEILSNVTGLPSAQRRFPSAFPMIAGRVSQFVEGNLLKREPRVPLEAAQMATTTMTFDDSRARKELGYRSRPATMALYDSARWFVDNGYVTTDRSNLLRWRMPSDEPPQVHKDSAST